MNAFKLNKNILQSVQNGLKILKLFTVEKPVWGITEIANHLQLTKSTVSRLVTDLVSEGYLERVNKKYRLGLSILGLSGVIATQLEIDREAKETLEYLVEKLGESAHLSILEDDRVTYISKIECQHPVRLLSNVGKNNPASCTSSGKVLLAYQPEHIIQQIISRGLVKYGPNSVVDSEVFLRELKKVRQEGVAICINELHDGVTSIAAPVRDYSGNVIAAVSIVGPNERITSEKIHMFVEEIKEAGHVISQKLGYIEALY